MENVIKILDTMNIKYNAVNHPPALTTEEADDYIKGMEGVASKTLFMAGKKDRNFYLIIMDDSKMLNIKKLNEITGDKLHFGKKENLKCKMMLEPGIVSLFGLINNNDHDIKVYIDKELLKEEIITFHPNVNTSTFFISIDDMFVFLEKLGYEYKLVEL